MAKLAVVVSLAYVCVSHRHDHKPTCCLRIQLAVMQQHLRGMRQHLHAVSNIPVSLSTFACSGDVP